MIYIRKQRTPNVVKQRASEIMNAPENKYSELTLPQDSKKLRELFEQMPKDEIANALYREQHGLCAYCMRRMNPRTYGSMRIEHYEALSKNKKLALDYQNYLGVCFGGENDNESKPHILCCDAARKAAKITINPWDERQMEAIAYAKDGQIFVRTDRGLDPQLVTDMQNDIDNILALNGKKSIDGKVLYDTASKLVATRRSIYQSVSTQFDRWDRKKCLTAEFLKDKIDNLEKQLKGDAIADPFIGVRLYRYKKKYKKLKARQ